MAISVCRSYRTVSTEASLILANMLPLDLRATQLAANFQLSARLGSSSQAHPKGHFTTIQRLIADAGLQINNCNRWNRSTIGHIPPWSTPKFEIITSISTEPELHPSHESTLHIYTDGSKSENRVGFSTVIVDQHSILLVIRGKLPEYASSYDAESVAINDALKYTVVHGQSYASVRIFTDSLSNLHSLKSNRKLSSTSISNQRLAHQAAKRTKISLEWVRGHRGIVGNELADHHAKLAATSSTTPRKFLMPLASSKLAIKSHLHCKWNQQWIESEGFATLENRRTPLPRIRKESRIRSRIGKESRIRSRIGKESRIRVRIGKESRIRSRIGKESRIRARIGKESRI